MNHEQQLRFQLKVDNNLKIPTPPPICEGMCGNFPTRSHPNGFHGLLSREESLVCTRLQIPWPQQQIIRHTSGCGSKNRNSKMAQALVSGNMGTKHCGLPLRSFIFEPHPYRLRATQLEAPIVAFRCPVAPASGGRKEIPSTRVPSTAFLGAVLLGF